MAGSRSLGTLTLDLIAKIGGFTGPLDQAGRVADARLKAIERRAKQFGVALGAAISAAGVAIAAGVKRAIDQADALNDLHERLGLSAEALSGFAYAAKQTGTDIDGLGIGLKKLSKNMAEALDPKSAQGKLFDALDIEPLDAATGKLKSLEAILPEIADRFKELNDETLEAALAQQIFGKSGADLLEFLNLGSDGIESMRDKLRDLGGELSQGTLTAADQFNDKLGDLRTASDAMFTALAADLLPELNKLVDRMVEAAKDGSEFRQQMESAVTVLKALGEMAGAVADTVRGLTSAVLGLYNAADSLSKLNPGRALGEAVSRMFGGDTGDSLAENWRDLKTAAEQTAEAFGLVDAKGKAAAVTVAGFGKGIRGGGGKGFSFSPARRGFGDLYNLLNGGDDPKKTKSGGKSDAEREAEQLAEAIKRMNAQMAEQIALFGQTSEVAKVRYDLENGELAKASAAEKEQILRKAAILDQLKAEADETERLNKLEEERRETIERAHQALTDTFSDLQFEIDLLGKSNAERMAEIELRRIGAGLTDQERAAAKDQLVSMAQEYEALQKSVDRWDEMRDASDDFWMSLSDGSATGIEALKEFGNQFAHMLQRMASEWATTQLFGERGTMGGGLFGGIVSSIFGGFGGGGSGFGNPALDLSAWTGAGYANGTDFHPGGWSLVGEKGPEVMYVPRGAEIVPNHKLGGVAGGSTFYQTNNFPVVGRIDNRSRMQIAQAGESAGRMAARRNGR